MSKELSGTNARSVTDDGADPSAFVAVVDLQTRSALAGSRAEQVAHLLADRLADVPPGTRLGTREELRQQVGIAIATFNEVLRLLSARGVITTRPGPGGGIFRARQSPALSIANAVVDFGGAETSLRELVRLRFALEQPLVEDVISFSTTSDHRRLAKIVATIATAADNADAVRYARAVDEFCQALAALSPNHLLQSMYLSVNKVVEARIIDVARGIGEPDHDLVQARAQLHRRLLDAIVAGDGEAARELVHARGQAMLSDIAVTQQDGAGMAP